MVSYNEIAYGDAAAVALEIGNRPLKKMNSLICYYPTAYPARNLRLPPNLGFLLHLSADSRPAPAHYTSFTYPETEAGFAQPDAKEYDLVAARLAWSRTLAVVKKKFRIETDLEKIWEDHMACKFSFSYFLPISRFQSC
jgi:hypothetical protein